MIGFTDIHSHFLYGMDDGPKTKAEMEAMLDAAYADGITTLFATPHVTPGLSQLDEDRMGLHLQEARDYCHAKGYQMNLLPGAEILYAPTLETVARERRLPTLANSSRVLVEFVPDISYSELSTALDILIHCGYDPILAHIERYHCLFKGRNAFRLKNEFGVQYQVNCNSILKKRGWFKDYCLKKWLDCEIIDFIASDSHDTTHHRPTRMTSAHKALLQRYPEEHVNKLFSVNID